MKQTDRLLEYLQTHRAIDPMTAWDKLGIYRLGARVHDLRKAGHNIESSRVAVDNRFGEQCHVARYRLAA
jgi:hypothetical protein